mgnify:FL=1
MERTKSFGKQVKHWIGLGIGILVAMILVYGSVALGAGKLVVTYNPMPLNVPSIVMKDQGFLEEAMAELGLELEYKPFMAGYLMTEAMAAGELDIAAVMGGTSTITSYAGGRELQIFAAYSQAPAGFALVTKAGSVLNNVKDLKGKAVGLPVGTETHLLLAKALEEAGLEFKDIQVVNMLVPDAVTALMAGQIDAACIVEPVLSNLATQGKIVVLRDGTGLMPGLTVMTVRRDLREQRPEILTAYLQAHARSLEFMEREPDKTMELVAKETKLPPELVEKVMVKYTFSPEIGPELLAGLDGTALFLQEIGIIREPIDLEGLVDTTILDELYAD